MRCDIVNNPHFQMQLINLAQCNGLLAYARQAEAALQDHLQLVQQLFGVLAAGPPGQACLTSASFRSGVRRVVPEVNAEQLDELEEQLGWFRDDAGEGIDGMQIADVCS